MINTNTNTNPNIKAGGKTKRESGQVPKDYLQGYCGYIQTDGYSGYDDLGKQPGIIHVGCWTHARRMFVDVLDALPAQARKKKAGNATTVALSYIGKLYAIEAGAREEEFTPEQIYQLRQEKSKPILEEFKDWLTRMYPQTPPKGLLGKAMEYASISGINLNAISLTAA